MLRDLIEAGCGDILHMQGVALLPKARNYQIGTLIFPYPDMRINVFGQGFKSIRSPLGYSEHGWEGPRLSDCADEACSNGFICVTQVAHDKSWHEAHRKISCSGLLASFIKVFSLYLPLRLGI